MKELYWRPRTLSRPALVLMAAFSLAGFAAVESYRPVRPHPHYDEMRRAAEQAAQAMEAIAQVRAEKGLINLSNDPAGSGLIGLAMSPVTSAPGSLPAKQTTINPNFAAVVVRILREAGVKPGDTVAAGFSGSFPALNICVLAAIETMRLHPIVISSASASRYGANDPDWLWIDMEGFLHERGILKHRSTAVSLGGLHDTGEGLSEEGVRELKRGIERSDLPFLAVDSAEESIAQRMALYRAKAGEAPIAAYINIGGGAVSVGGPASKHDFKAGLNLKPPPGELADSVMARFIEQGVPVIHLVRINHLADLYGLPHQPQSLPPPGSGGVYYRQGPSRVLAGGVLALIAVGLYLLVHSRIAGRLLRSDSPSGQDLYEEPMV